MRVHALLVITLFVRLIECRHLRQDKNVVDQPSNTNSRELQVGDVPAVTFSLINAKDNTIIDSIKLDGSSEFDLKEIGTNELTVRAESRISSSLTPATYVEFSWTNDSTSTEDIEDNRSLQEYHIVQSQDIRANNRPSYIWTMNGYNKNTDTNIADRRIQYNANKYLSTPGIKTISLLAYYDSKDDIATTDPKYSLEQNTITISFTVIDSTEK